MRFALLLLQCLLLVLGGATLLRAPDWFPWKLVLVAGEYGHWLVALPLVVGALAVWTGPRTWAVVSVATGALTVVLLLRPLIDAANLSRELPARFRTGFGAPAGEVAPPFAMARLFGSEPAAVHVETRRFAGELELDFYRPVAPSSRAAPCVVVVHGGGWNAGDRNQLAAMNHRLAHRGYAVAAISYRLAPRHVWPAQRDDVLAALAYLKTRAAELGLDPGRLILFGRSAGGQIAEAVAYGANDPAIKGVIALYAPADLEFAWSYAREDDALKSPGLLRAFLGGTPATVPESYRTASGYTLASRGSPPTLLLHGALDTLVWHRQSERLAARLAELGAPCVFVSLPWATHAFDFDLRTPGGQIAWWSVEQFLAAVTRE